VARPPVASPRPDVPPELDDEPTTNPGAPVDVGYLKAKLEEVATRHDAKIRNSGWLRTAVATVTGTGVAIAVFLVFVDNRVRAETDAGVAAHESRIKALEQQVPQLRDEVYQGRLDTQALYKAVMDGKRQQRLEQPPAPPAKDGGT
jgi:hypothetical protein